MDVKGRKMRPCRWRLQEQNTDRISQLPTCILHDILSDLSVKDKLRACLVSKSWYTQLWPSLPPRSFSFVPKGAIVTGSYTVKQQKQKQQHKQQQEFINSVETSFQKFHSERFILVAFKISLDVFNYENVTCADRWLQLALKNGLRRLCIHSPPNIWYKVPAGIVSASAAPLQELELTHCSLQKKSQCDDGDIGPLALKRLSMVSVSLQDDDFQNFISRCTSLEYFLMDDCSGVNCLRLGKLSKLKELDVKVKQLPYLICERLAKVVVDSLSLQAIRIVCCIQYSPSMVVSFTRCRNLQHLYLCHLTLENHFLRNLAITCPVLRTLCLERCYGLESPTVLRHPRLQTLQLFSLPDSYDISIDTPNLLSLELNSDIFQTSLCLPDKSSIPRPLRQFCLKLKVMCPLYTPWFIQFRAYLVHVQKNTVNGNFNASLCVYTSMPEFNVDIASEGLRTYDHACDVEELRIHMRQSLENYATFFDGLFWSCRPKKLFVKLDGPRKELLKDKRDIVMITRGDSTCCMSCPVKCWRHFIKLIAVNGTNATDSISVETVLQNQSRSEEIVLTLDWS